MRRGCVKSASQLVFVGKHRTENVVVLLEGCFKVEAQPNLNLGNMRLAHKSGEKEEVD